MSKNKYSSLIVLLISSILLVIVLKDNFLATIKVIKDMNMPLFIISIIIYFTLTALEGTIFKKLVHEYKRSYKLSDALNLSLVTRFFNGITPFSSGGRPLQLYELKKRGVSYSDGTNVIVQNFVIFQISIILFSIVSLILNKIFGIFDTNSFLYHMTILGFIINIVILLVGLFFSINEKINKKIILSIVNFGIKLRIVKEKETLMSKLNDFCDSYYYGFKDFKHKYDLIIKCVIYEEIALVLYFATAYVVFLALGINASFINLFEMIIASNLVFLAGSFVPIPGGSGGIEYAYIGYFETFALGGELASSLIIWRFVTYYLPTLFGGILFNITKKKEKDTEEIN